MGYNHGSMSHAAGGGKGGTRSSVLDHRFGAGPPLTVGVEEEYMLVDPETWDLVSGVEPLLEKASESEFADRLKPELMQCVLESGTVVCEDVPAAEADLRHIRAYVAEHARAEGMRLAASGTHPFSLYENQKITARDRYRALVEMLQYVARRELVFGMHVHVAVPTPEAGLAVMEGVLIELPVLLALSANSPFWRGERTGLASTRAMIFAAFPRSGLPPRFESYQDYANAVGFMEATGAIGDYTHLWWDVRPHPRFGTLEVRVMDCQTRVEDTIALAAYVQCLVKHLLDRFQAGEPVLVVSPHADGREQVAGGALRPRRPAHGPVGGQAGQDACQDARQAAPARAEADRARAGLRRGPGGDRRDPREGHGLRAAEAGVERKPRRQGSRVRARNGGGGGLTAPVYPLVDA